MGKCISTYVVVPENVPAMFDRAIEGDAKALVSLEAIQHWLGLDRERLSCVTCDFRFGSTVPRGFVLMVPQYVADPEVMIAGICARCFEDKYAPDWKAYCLAVSKKVASDVREIPYEEGHA